VHVLSVVRPWVRFDWFYEQPFTAAADQNITLDLLVGDLKQCIPMLSSSKFAFDPFFYILFWALELPDLAEDTQQRYSELKQELLSKLDSEKRALKDMLVAQDRNRAKAARSYDAQDEPIITQAALDSKKQDISELEEKLEKLTPECEACHAHAGAAKEVLRQHADKCIPSANGQQNLSNAFMQVLTCLRDLPVSASGTWSSCYMSGVKIVHCWQQCIAAVHAGVYHAALRVFARGRHVLRTDPAQVCGAQRGQLLAAIHGQCGVLGGALPAACLHTAGDRAPLGVHQGGVPHP
jgi:hypothetical protein